MRVCDDLSTHPYAQYETSESAQPRRLTAPFEGHVSPQPRGRLNVAGVEVSMLVRHRPVRCSPHPEALKGRSGGGE